RERDEEVDTSFAEAVFDADPQRQRGCAAEHPDPAAPLIRPTDIALDGDTKVSDQGIEEVPVDACREISADARRIRIAHPAQRTGQVRLVDGRLAQRGDSGGLWQEVSDPADGV